MFENHHSWFSTLWISQRHFWAVRSAKIFNKPLPKLVPQDSDMIMSGAETGCTHPMQPEVWGHQNGMKRHNACRTACFWKSQPNKAKRGMVKRVLKSKMDQTFTGLHGRGGGSNPKKLEIQKVPVRRTNTQTVDRCLRGSIWGPPCPCKGRITRFKCTEEPT